MSIKPTDNQLAMLTAAAQRDDRCLAPPGNLKASAAQKAAAKLVAAGLAKEIRAKGGAPVWRRDEQAGRSYALKLTAAGARAITTDEGATAKPASEDGSFREAVAAHNTAAPIRTPADVSGDGAPTGHVATPSAPRQRTKLAQIVALLQRESGATLGELITATGWLPHTARAALTGLRRRGYAVTLDRSDSERGSSYRIPANAGGSSAKDTARDDAAEVSDSLTLPAAQPTTPNLRARSRAREAA